MISVSDFGGCKKYIIDGGELKLELLDFGATVAAINFGGRSMCCGYDDFKGYLHDESCMCAVVGRYANRIGASHFVLDGKEYKVAPNEGKNQLHGGPNAFHRRVWETEIVSDNSVRMHIRSADGDNGFPGNLDMYVTYTVSGAEFTIEFDAETDAATVFSPTSHIYFNLDGGENILNNLLQINSSHYLEVDDELIPTGVLLQTDRDFDFRTEREIARDFDHCFCLDGEYACTVTAGGVRLRIDTDLPGIQLYTGMHLGAPHGKNGGLAIEPQFYPDSPNKPHFPSTVLKPGEKFHKWIKYSFNKI